MEEFSFPDPPDPRDLPWWRRIPKVYYWWGASLVFLGISFLWLPSQCSLDGLSMEPTKKNDLANMDSVNLDTDLEFKEDQLWYKIGEKKPFSGLAISYHENGKRRSQTTVKDGVAYGLIEEWDENGTRLGANFKDEFKRRK